jgi:hypothetical protein
MKNNRPVPDGRAHEKIVRLPGRRWLQQRALGLSLVDMGHEDGNDRPGNFILNSEDVLQLAVVAFYPMVSAGNSIDELSADANAITSATDTAFEDVAHAELAAASSAGQTSIACGGCYACLRMPRSVGREMVGIRVTSRVRDPRRG